MARLLRIRLLVVDVDLTVAPAPARAPARPAPPAVTREPPGAIGSGLAAAERCLSEGRASLARAAR